MAYSILKTESVFLSHFDSLIKEYTSFFPRVIWETRG